MLWREQPLKIYLATKDRAAKFLLADALRCIDKLYEHERGSRTFEVEIV